MSHDTAEQILREIKSLRRELSLLLPAESLDEYANKDEILSAHADARGEFNIPRS